jgi:hypothetical protein
MARDAATIERLRSLLSQINSLTEEGELHWEREVGSAHRYARWNNNLLILGPAAALRDKKTPRYLFITPFDSPACIEINSADKDVGPALLDLVNRVETSSRSEPPTDPFAITDDILSRLTD